MDPLLFWKNNEIKFIQLSRLAKAFLGIPVTSAYIERFFSKTGFIMRPHRRCMGDDLPEFILLQRKLELSLEKLIFIKI